MDLERNSLAECRQMQQLNMIFGTEFQGEEYKLICILRHISMSLCHYGPSIIIFTTFPFQM